LRACFALRQSIGVGSAYRGIILRGTIVDLEQIGSLSGIHRRYEDNRRHGQG